MIIKSTDMQNNFGKYLKLCNYEDIIISRNGKEIAKLVTLNAESVREEAINYEAENNKMTYEEFLSLTEVSDNRFEYINGQVFLMASPRITHQLVQTVLLNIFSNWFAGKKCTPLTSPFDITLTKDNNKNVVQPDIVVICDLEKMTDEKDRYMGTPTLIVEILSQSSISRDYVLKMDLYMNSGVEEYWIVDPFNKEINIFRFKDCNIIEKRTWKNQEIAKSMLFEGLAVCLSEIFR